MGNPVLNGACTSFGAAIPLMACELVFFTKFGIFMGFTILFSWLYANFCFMSIMAAVGPETEIGGHKHTHGADIAGEQEPRADRECQKEKGMGAVEPGPSCDASADSAHGQAPCSREGRGGERESGRASGTFGVAGETCERIARGSTDGAECTAGESKEEEEAAGENAEEMRHQRAASEGEGGDRDRAGSSKGERVDSLSGGDENGAECVYVSETVSVELEGGCGPGPHSPSTNRPDRYRDV